MSRENFLGRAAQILTGVVDFTLGEPEIDKEFEEGRLMFKASRNGNVVPPLQPERITESPELELLEEDRKARKSSQALKEQRVAAEARNSLKRE